MPSGVTVNVGTPIAVDNPTDPTIIQFPFSFTRSAGTRWPTGATPSRSRARPVNRSSSEGRQGPGALRSKITFTLADMTSPTITGTTFTGRTVSITFSKAVDPATVTAAEHLRAPARAAPPSGRRPPTTLRTTSISTATPVRRSATDASDRTDVHRHAQLQRPAPDRAADRQVRDRGPEPARRRELGRHRPGGQLRSSASSPARFPTGADETTPQDFIQNLGQQTLAPPRSPPS